MKWDRSWLQLPKTDAKYRAGCVEFIELAFKHSSRNNKISCPCRDCKNKKWHEKDSALVHLLTKGLYQDYACLSGGICIMSQENFHHHHQVMTLIVRDLVMLFSKEVLNITVF